jgi:hypothetical protein
VTRGRNAYNVRELAGAFGDLGTFIPFLVGYLTVSKMDPVGVLVAFGIFKIGGLELATGAPGDASAKQDRYVLLLTAGIAMWNMGAGYLAGLLLHHATRRGVVRL